MTQEEYQSELNQLQLLWSTGTPVKVDTVTDLRRQAIGASVAAMDRDAEVRARAPVRQH